MKIIPPGFSTLAEYVDDIVRMGTRSDHSPVKGPIQWSAREWTPTAQELADYGPSAGRVLNFFDYLENVPAEAILIGERTPMRMLKNPLKVPLQEPYVGASLYIPRPSVLAYLDADARTRRPDLLGAGLAARTVGHVWGAIPKDTIELRSKQDKNARAVVREILKSRLGLEDAAANRHKLAVTAEVLSDLPSNLYSNRYSYQMLTTPAETGLLSAQAADRVGSDFLEAMLSLSSGKASREALTPARVLLLSEAGNFGPEIVTQAIGNIVARGAPVRGITVQDEIFRLLNREDLRPEFKKDDIATVAKNIRDREQTFAQNVRAGATDVDLIPDAKTPEARRMNKLLNRLLTADEKEGLSYLTPEQFGEFIQKVLRERAPEFGA